jgi:4'-phosphopantetheinyl transferase
MALQHRPASQWDLEFDAAGRPLLRCLEKHDTLCVSLSHTRGCAACMVGRRHDVGIDVEACDLAAPDDTPPAWLSADEQTVLARLAPVARADATVRLWTLKEALAKAVGRGLSLPFGDIRFSIDPPRLVSAPRAGQGRWQFAQWRPTPTHMLSAAVRCKGRQPVEIAFERVSPQTLGALAEGGPV